MVPLHTVVLLGRGAYILDVTIQPQNENVGGREVYNNYFCTFVATKVNGEI